MTVIRATRRIALLQALLTMLFLLAGGSMDAMAEGSRSLYPDSYPSICGTGPGQGCRANLDLQPTQKYIGKVIRRTFLYVYAEAGEYILLGSRNRANGGDILVYNPGSGAQAFGTPGDETIPSTQDFSCAAASAPAGSFSGGSRGLIPSRDAERAGPNSADGSATVPSGFSPCAYLAPSTGIYGVLFTAATSGGGAPNGSVTVPNIGNNSVSAWDVTVRNSAGSTVDINGRLFTYAWVGNTTSASRPVFSTHYYITKDGYRYRQDLRGLDPIGYVLYANRFGFRDNTQPLYKDIRGNEALVTSVPIGVTTDIAEFPIFFSDITPNGPIEGELAKVLGALNIPTTPDIPTASNPTFEGPDPTKPQTTPGVGGNIKFDTTNTITYEIVISRDGVDFDPATPTNRVLNGIVGSGTALVPWDGKDNAGVNFPAQTGLYTFRVRGQNGDIHFPMVDIENNPGKGPTITRLNGSDGVSTQVYYDDRGYRTASGVLVGNLNGTLCDNTPPTGPTVQASLSGVDSRTDYRDWLPGSNANTDCAANAGWGDAKALNLWTYFSTPNLDGTLTINESSVDLATSVTGPDLVAPGATVQGTVTFINNGNVGVSGVGYQLLLPPGLSDVVFSNLPAGVIASYDPVSGQVTFTGLPTTLNPGQTIPSIGFTFTAPTTGNSLTVTSSILVPENVTDTVPGNNTASKTTAIGSTDVSTSVTAPAVVAPGDPVSGTINFANNSGTTAPGVTYSASIGTGGIIPAAVDFSGLPTGATATFSPDGTIIFTGLPTNLAAGQSFSIGFNYIAPNLLGEIPVRAAVTTSATDANGGNDTDTQITIVAPNPPTGPVVPVPPDAVDQNLRTPLNTPVSGNVTNQGSIPPGSTVTLNSNPSSGSVTLNPDGSFTYVPNRNFTGTDAFTYKVCLAPPDQGVCDIATVNIIVGDGTLGAGPGASGLTLTAGRTAIRCGRAVTLRVRGGVGRGKLRFSTVAEGAVSCRIKKSQGKYFLRTSGTPPGSCTVTATKLGDATHEAQTSNSVIVSLR